MDESLRQLEREYFNARKRACLPILIEAPPDEFFEAVQSLKKIGQLAKLQSALTVWREELFREIDTATDRISNWAGTTKLRIIAARVADTPTGPMVFPPAGPDGIPFSNPDYDPTDPYDDGR